MFTRTSISRVWREEKSHYRLEATKCLKCSKIHYPPRVICDKCGSRNLERIALSGKGKILTYAIQHVVFSGFREYTPLMFAIILLEEGVKVLGQLTDISPDKIKIGMKVEAVLRKIAEDETTGIIKYALKFRPTREI